MSKKSSNLEDDIESDDETKYLLGDHNKKAEVKRTSILYFPHRYRLAILGFFGFSNVYSLRTVLSIAIPKMKTEYNWTSTEQGYVLSAFFAGYILTQIPGGWLASKYGGKWVLGCGLLITSALTLLTPLLTQFSIYALISLRFLEGFAEGVSYPSMHTILSHWSVPSERAKMGSICYSGAYIGNILALSIGGVLCSSTFLGGWPSAFYLFGLLGIIWFFLWAYFTSSTPEEDPTISKEEREYIINSIQLPNDQHIPWKAIFTNIPVWALIITHTCANWAFYTLLTWMPTFIADFLGFDLASTGVLSVLPYITQTVSSIFFGALADYSTKCCSLTTIRKVFNNVGFTISAACLIVVGYLHNVPLSLLFLSISYVGNGLSSSSGYLINHIDIGGEYAGILMSLSNSVATIPGIVSPTLTGMILGPNPTLHNWLIVFYISGGVFVFGIIVWTFFSSGERQKSFYPSSSNTVN